MDIKVVVEGVELPKGVVDQITISYAWNGLARAEFLIPGDVLYPGFLSQGDVYERFSAILLRGYPDVRVFVDGALLFEGLLTNVTTSRTENGASVRLECDSHFTLTALFNTFLINFSQFGALGQWWFNGATYPKLTTATGLGGADWLVRELIGELVELFREGGRVEDPFAYLAERVFKLYERIDREEFAIADWALKFLEVLPLYEYVRSYPPNSRHVVRFFGEYSTAINDFFAFAAGAILKESSSVLNLFQLYLKLLATFRQGFVEVLTERGLEMLIKPQWMFYPPPKSNLFPSHCLTAYSVMEETGLQRPTRTFVRPINLMFHLAENADPLIAGAVALNQMVAAPEELEKAVVLDVAEQLGIAVDSDRTLEEIVRAVYATLEVRKDNSFMKRYHAFLTEEEKQRGVVPHYVDLPPGISDALTGSSPRNWLLLKELAQLEHLSARAQFSTVSLTTTFNPYAIAGHPFMFHDGWHAYGGFAAVVTHTISSQGAVTSISGTNFTRVDEKTEFGQFTSVFEMVEDGDKFHTLTEEDLENYYRTVLGTTTGTYEELKKMEDLKHVDEPASRTVQLYDAWRRPLPSEGKPQKVDDQIKELVEAFVEGIRLSHSDSL